MMHLNKNINDFIEKLRKLFNVDVNIEIKEITTRKEMNLISGYKTPSWLVGRVKDGKIYIFSKKVLEKVSPHKKEEHEEILKHEIVHLFLHKAFGRGPAWFDEGVASILAGQNRKLPDVMPDPTQLISKEQFGNEKDAYAKAVKLVLNLVEGLNERNF